MWEVMCVPELCRQVCSEAMTFDNTSKLAYDERAGQSGFQIVYSNAHLRLRRYSKVSLRLKEPTVLIAVKLNIFCYKLFRKPSDKMNHAVLWLIAPVNCSRY